jgi:hypothetical protein
MPACNLLGKGWHFPLQELNHRFNRLYIVFPECHDPARIGAEDHAFLRYSIEQFLQAFPGEKGKRDFYAEIRLKCRYPFRLQESLQVRSCRIRRIELRERGSKQINGGAQRKKLKCKSTTSLELRPCFIDFTHRS